MARRRIANLPEFFSSQSDEETDGRESDQATDARREADALRETARTMRQTDPEDDRYW